MICFPPAGAGAGFFRDWHDSLPRTRIVPVQLPGREERFSEPPMADAKEIATEVAAAIMAEQWPEVVLLGYSYGSVLAFETARQLEAEGMTRVSAVLACARAAPGDVARETTADWPDADLLAYVRGLGGLPPEVDAEPAFLDLLVPIFRADFRANDLYEVNPSSKINAPIVTIAGISDPAMDNGRGEAWGKLTRTCHQLVNVEGGHFFVLDNPESSFDAIQRAAAQGGLVS